jgi:hypothetical protein
LIFWQLPVDWSSVLSTNYKFASLSRGLVNFLGVELLYFLALDEGSIYGFHERIEFLSLVFWAYKTSIQSNWEFIIN